MAGFAAILLIQMTTVSALAAGSAQLASDVQVADLRCEYMVDPLGIDVAQPRLSWKLESPWRGQRQTAMSCALYHGLVPGDQRQKVLDNLVTMIEKNGGHLDAGILGTKYLIDSLTAGGRADAVYTMATKTDYPSWGRWIAEGATTLWEQWDGNASRNHIMFGDISAWFYQVLGGIMPDSGAVGFKHFIIKPQLLGDVKWVRAQHESMCGTIKSTWEIQGDKFNLKVAVPVSTTATVYVPCDRHRVGSQGPNTIRTDDHTRFVRAEGSYAVYEVESGSYEFTSPLPR